MESIELFRKIGYKQRYTDSHCVIYDLKKENRDKTLPDTIIIQKGSYNIELLTDRIEEYTSLGTFSFTLTNELLDAINQKCKELKETENKR